MSRSKRGLAVASLILLAAGLAVGVTIHYFRRPPPTNLATRILARGGLATEHEDDELEKLSPPDDRTEENPPHLLDAFEAELADPAVTFPELFTQIPELAPHVWKSDEAPLRALLAHRFTDAEAILALDYLAAWNASDPSAYDRLKAAAETANPPRLANYAVGRIELKRKNYLAAAHYFEKEGERPEAYASRYRAILALLKARDFTALAALEKDPRYRTLFDPYVAMKLAAGRKDWGGILRLLPEVQGGSYTVNAVLMSLIAALGWTIFLTHVGEWSKPFGSSSLLAGIAIGCGVISTFPTLYVAVVQEDVLHVAAGDEPMRVFLYYVAGVGTREEVCKLLLFLPLLPILLKRDDELEVLITASFVGLGFAIEENAGYFTSSDATSTVHRFLTANFFHLALTGVNGLALFRAFRWGMRGLNEFLWVFPLSIVAHGAYDALLDLSALSQGGYVALAVFVGFSYLYFERAHALRGNTRMTIGLTGAFVLATAMVLAALVANQVANVGVNAGLRFALSEVLGSGVLVIVFIRVFDERLSP